MSDTQTNEGGRIVTLKIHFQLEEIEKLYPVAIRVVGEMKPGTVPLSVLWNRPRCGQETRKTVAPVPRQIQITIP